MKWYFLFLSCMLQLIYNWKLLFSHWHDFAYRKAVIFVIATIKDWDARILNRINSRTYYNWFDRLMRMATTLGNYGYVWIFISALLLFNEKTLHTALQAIFGLILTTAIGEGIIKHIARRKRPFFHFKHLKLNIAAPITYSFPSGHTASSFCSLCIIGSLNAWVFLSCLCLALSISYSRMYLKVHYPSDVLCGMILGICCGVFVLHFGDSIISALLLVWWKGRQSSQLYKNFSKKCYATKRQDS